MIVLLPAKGSIYLNNDLRVERPFHDKNLDFCYV